ncbi:MAG TPA: DinB family protein [Ktedonobacterales bacterium]|nr:DinB family protein [Ktedonobacterales bacterium]
MDTLRSLYAYNAWANARVFAVCRDIDQPRLEAQAPGTYGTIARTLQHLVVVEDAYIHMLLGDSLERVESREDHDVGWFADRSAQLGREYPDLLANAGESFYADALVIPWFDFTLTKHDGLLQVLSHSAQHRAQVLSIVGARGQEVPDLDYVLYVEEQAAGKSGERA